MEKHREVTGLFDRTAITKAGEEEIKEHIFIASTSAPDRHKTVLNQKNWQLDNYNNNPIIGYMHNVYGNGCNDPDPSDVIGKGRAFFEGGDLRIGIIFDDQDEKAQKVESKVDRGFLNTVSVGFIEVGDGHRGNEDDDEDKDLYYFHGQELLEVSIVNIPSNPEAGKKSLRSQTFDALRFVHRTLGLRFSEIEDMKVRDVIDMLEGKKPEEIEEKTTPVGEYNLRIAKHKQSALTGAKNNS